MEIRNRVKPHILWKVQQGNISFWGNNWSGMGQLAQLLYIQNPGNLLVEDCIKEGAWNIKLLELLVPTNMVQHIREIKIGNTQGQSRAIWRLSTDGFFSCSTAFDLLRQRSGHHQMWKDTWIKHIPFKISFSMWRIWKKKTLVDEIIFRFGQRLDSKCSCCRQPQEETIEHVFNTSPKARAVWTFFSKALGFHSNSQSLYKNTYMEESDNLKFLYQDFVSHSTSLHLLGNMES